MPHTSFDSIRRAREKGIAVYLTAFFLMVLIPVVGLSIDGGYAFVIRSRLSAAADSAALAAGRGINLSGTQAQANTQATTQATNFFNADFPSGYMNTSTSNRTITPTFTVNKDGSGNPTGTLTIAMVVQVVAPTYFMKWLGIPSLTINAAGTATRRNLVLELVLDKSASMGTRTGAQVGHIPATLNVTDTPCQAMVYASSQFLTYFSPYDYIGEISFDLSAYDDYTPSTSYGASGAGGIDNILQNLNCGSNTNTTAALYKAYHDIITVNQKLAQNVIVLFTDSVPNAVNATTFPVRTKVDSRLSPSQTSTLPACMTSNGWTQAQVTANCPSANTCADTGGQILCTSAVIGSTLCPGGTGCAAGNLTAGGSAPGGLPVCTTTASNINIAISQTNGFNVHGGSRGSWANMFSTDSNPSTPAGCVGSTGDASIFTSQTLAYIPNSDYFGNSFVTVTNAASTPASPWIRWIYGDTAATGDYVNYTCAPAAVTITYGNTRCKNLGDLWTNHAALGAGADYNTFQTGPYTGFLRPDTLNSIGTASMTSATNMAYTIRADSTYNVTIDVVYLQGNGSDPVDRSFLQLVSNQQYIQPLIYETNPTCPGGALGPAANAGTCQTGGAYTNPYYQSSQQLGLWEQTATTTELVSMFEAIASSLLRISQ